jgi:hypothetical protein
LIARLINHVCSIPVILKHRGLSGNYQRGNTNACFARS